LPPERFSRKAPKDVADDRTNLVFCHGAHGRGGGLSGRCVSGKRSYREEGRTWMMVAVVNVDPGNQRVVRTFGRRLPGRAAYSPPPPLAGAVCA
jgi:hypothetical protein